MSGKLSACSSAQKLQKTTTIQICASLAHLPVQYLGEPYCLLQARDIQHKQPPQKRKPDVPPLPALPCKVPEGSEALQAAPCGWKAGWSLSRHLRQQPVWDMMSNGIGCHTRTSIKGKASMLGCASAQFQVWKGMSSKPNQLALNWPVNPIHYSKNLLIIFSICLLFRSFYYQRCDHPDFAWEVTDISIKWRIKRKNKV